MSDSILRIIPSEPTFVPSIDAQQGGASLVREAFPHADDVSVRIEDDVTFVDAGENFDAVFCPQCKSELEQDGWADAMERAASTGFLDLDVPLPCCGESTSLNDLRYEMPQGFARFVIDVVNPETADIPESLEARLGDVLGSTPRFVWTQY